ncbi:MAG TPA: diguanylate phosphodiesterase, partial [Vicinamibacteria bacterium]|nr:diguanylate phosphodiesterase [Vicinamibacteria bacterium]
MSSEDTSRKGQEFFQMFLKAKEFTEELLKENERLRFRLATLDSGASASGDERVRDLQARVRELEERLAELEARHRRVEEENKEFADRYIEIEEQNNNLANLYVASYQLHSTVDFREVVRIVQEIVINLIGAEVFHVLMVSEKTGLLEVEASEGQTPGRTTIPVG